MKKTIYRADDRGFTNHGWLKSYHTFSFANYYEESKCGFGKLLVFNDDIVQPDSGFGTHAHDNMEIISIPLMGTLEHKDSIGNNHIIKKGNIQVMSAGTGLTHSEYNPSTENPLHFLQLWILPDKPNIKPVYQQQHFKFVYDTMVPVITPKKQNGSMSIHQDAYLYLGKFRKNNSFIYQLSHSQHGVFVFVIEGRIKINEEFLHKNDAIGAEGFSDITILFQDNSDILLLEIPMDRIDF